MGFVVYSLHRVRMLVYLTRRAFLSSRVIQRQGKSSSRWLVKKVIKIDRQNEDISNSVSSIESGAIFLSRLAHELSRNIIVVSVYAL